VEKPPAEAAEAKVAVKKEAASATEDVGAHPKKRRRTRGGAQASAETTACSSLQPSPPGREPTKPLGVHNEDVLSAQQLAFIRNMPEMPDF
jgi:hypothetical protein